VIRVLIVSPSSVSRREIERAVAQDPGLALLAASDSLESPDVIVLDPGTEPELPLLLEQRPSHDTTPLVVLLEDLEHDAGARALRAGARAVLPRDAAPEEIRAAVQAVAAGLAALPADLAIALLDGKSSDGAHVPLDTDGTLTPREREILTLLGEGLVNREIPEEIRAAVQAVAAGLAALPADLAIALLDGKSSDGAHAPLDTDGTLTPREREILTLLGEGLVNREIAVRLGISEHTVKTHLAAIYEKLEASNRAEAVATGLRRGLIML